MTAHTTISRRIARNLAGAAAVAGVLAIAGQATALPPVPPPVPPNAPPVAQLSVNPNPAVLQPVLVIDDRQVIGQLGLLRGGTVVTFNASRSTDSDGTIVSYDWDLDGNGSFEKTTTTPTTTRRYTAAGIVNTKVRVTDDLGAQRVKAVNLTIHKAPTPKITSSRLVALPGDAITLTGAGSTDDNGAITKHEWDLDDNGTFERTGAEIGASFGGTGTHVVKLRVTDTLGATAVSSVSIRVHRQPTADFATRPVAPGVGQLVTLDGALSDDDGTIARYQWDLDGNGSYETDGAATATVGTRFATAGPAKVGLKVTDNDGASSETTKTIQVNPEVVSTDTTAPALRPSKTLLRLRNGKVAVTVRCPITETTCGIAIRLKGTRGVLAGRTLATGATTVRGGRAVTVTLGLTKAAKAKVRKGAVIRAAAVITSTDAAGNRSATRTAVKLTR